MAWFNKKPDPISDRARALSEEIAGLEAQIKQLGARVRNGEARPRLRSTAVPRTFWQWKSGGMKPGSGMHAAAAACGRAFATAGSARGVSTDPALAASRGYVESDGEIYLLTAPELQKFTVAQRALSGDPLILLADEPTGNLDSANGEAVMNLMRELHQAGSTICMVTHDPRYAEFADRTIRLFDGRIVEESVETAKG